MNPIAQGVCMKRGDVLNFAEQFVTYNGDVEESDVVGMWGAFE